MKRRVRKIVNFFAFNLLFFALYLNFIHKDNQNVQGTMPVATMQQQETINSSMALVNDAANQEKAVMPAANKPKEQKNSKLKLSIN
ncbi:MAG: hypothetical protein R2796_11060 [Chitinophagaceae bacterium]|nr:hypothetical protein [Chitinophagaceae bacterium]MCB0741071.1 hypothetical protein [Chitinophagaceae bacterium]HQU55799.1 hypothetical protein [Chitinophagaceae bacterium]HQV07097.1 hypothetical protein [Chitinophagaceae bacterium]